MRWINRVFRGLAGLEEGQELGRWLVALYGVLALTAMVLVIMWLSGGSLSCIAGGVCAR